MTAWQKIRPVFQERIGFGVWMNRMWVDALGILAAIAILFGLLVGVVAYASSQSCEQNADLYQLEHRWGLFLGCKVHVEGQWIDMGAIEVRGQAVRVFVPETGETP